MPYLDVIPSSGGKLLRLYGWFDTVVLLVLYYSQTLAQKGGEKNDRG